MSLPAWLGGGHGGRVADSDDDDERDLAESKRAREQAWREHVEIQARIASLREIADYLGRANWR